MGDERQIPPEVEKIYARFPHMRAVDQALEEYHRGNPVTVRCPKCGNLLVVRDLRPYSIWVLCGTPHCVIVHFKLSGSPLTESNPADLPDR